LDSFVLKIQHNLRPKHEEYRTTYSKLSLLFGYSIFFVLLLLRATHSLAK